jgi:SAM-dependent methyltransferase
MLAPANWPLRYHLWNLKWGAPRGRVLRGFLEREKRATPWGARLVGPFAYQTNNTTRAFEYPWAFEALDVARGQRILEIGGGLSGFQFVLDYAGAEVINVDPGDEFHTRGWPVTPETMARLNRVLGTKVVLKNCYLEDAKFPDASFDRIVSISVFEHIDEPVLAGILSEVRRILKPGGLVVMTVDLFLDVKPFADKETNIYGHNVSVKWIVETSGLKRIHGNPAELFGYPEFDAGVISRRRSEYLIGKYPGMVQTIVLRKLK